MKKNKGTGTPYFRRSAHVVWKNIKGKAVLLDLNSGAYFEVNGLGLAVLKLCDGKRTLEQMASRIGMAYKVSPDKAEREARRLIENLKKQNLVEALRAPNGIRPTRR